MDEKNLDLISTFVEANETKNYTSKIKFHQYELNWTIENFELICKNITLIESPKFPSLDETNRQWFLQIQTTELKEDNNTNNFVFKLKNTKDDKMYISTKISFFNSETQLTQNFVSNHIINSESYWSMSGSKLLERLGKSLAKNLIVKCKLSVFDSISTVEDEPPIKRRKCNDLMKNVPSLLSNENFKDVTFKLEDKEFTAHKAILAIQSPVFAAMFNSKMSEEQTSIVEIKDVKPKIFQQMLNFVYNVIIDDLDEVALELFYVAEKYQLEELKTICINSLHKNLSAKTVIKTLEVADLYSLSELKFECLNFVLKEWEMIKGTEELKNLIKNRPFLLIQIVQIINA